MAWKSLGKITVTTHGTPVQITTTHTDVHSIFIEANPANTGKIFVGLSTLVQATFVGCLAILPPPTTNSFPSVDTNIIGGPNALDLFDIWIDSTIDGDSVIISYTEN